VTESNPLLSEDFRIPFDRIRPEHVLGARRATATGALALVLALGAAACGDDAVVGGPDRIVVGAAPTVWEQLSDRLREVLEPTYFPLPDEQAFELVPADPTAEPWEEERRAHQVLLIGTPDDPWIADAWKRGVGPSPPVPSLTELTDLWAKGQRVLMLLLPPEGVDAALEETIADVRVTFDRWYREYVVERMYFPAGPDGVLADSLQVAATTSGRGPGTPSSSGRRTPTPPRSDAESR